MVNSRFFMDSGDASMEGQVPTTSAATVAATVTTSF
jgi:hypothetical protein